MSDSEMIRDDATVNDTGTFLTNKHLFVVSSGGQLHFFIDPKGVPLKNLPTSRWIILPLFRAWKIIKTKFAPQSKQRLHDHNQNQDFSRLKTACAGKRQNNPPL